jgi:hypothetical protein
VNGATYAAGGTIPGGGSVIYTGSATSFDHTGLVANKQYFYKAWSVMPGNSYSPGAVCSAVTLCEITTDLPFSEGFEASPGRPGCWYEDNTDPAWRFCAGNGLGAPYGYPATARSGERNACLLDATATPDYNTLITPLFNVSGYPDVQLKFWMFMQKWGSRQDELKVLYRTSPGSPWNLLQNFTQSVSAWTEQTIALPSGSGEIQLGFSGTAKWGLGICIDDIQVDVVPGVGLGEHALNDIRISPNPSAGIFRVTCGPGENLIREIDVFDCTGQKITGMAGKTEREFTFDLSFANPGIYVMKIKTEQGEIIRKLVLTK